MNENTYGAPTPSPNPGAPQPPIGAQSQAPAAVNAYANAVPHGSESQAAPAVGVEPETQAAPASAYGAPVQHEHGSPHIPEHAAPASPAATASSPMQPEAAAPKSGGGKSFICGFLGALLACALCIGGLFAFEAGDKDSSSSKNAGTTTTSKIVKAEEDGQTLAEVVAAKDLPSVVGVYNYQQGAVGSSTFGYGYGNPNSSALQQAGMGSGVIISNEGYILTNYHVVDGAKKITVTVSGEERDAEYVGGDKSSDVAVVKVQNTEGLQPMDIGNSDDLIIGEWVMTIGAPLGLEQSVATGVVSATNRSTIMDANADASNPYAQSSVPEYTYYPNMIQTDAVINPGNSGGALVDANGELIGINTMISSLSGDYAGVGFAIPVNYAMGIANDIIAGKTPTHAILGVSISNVNPQTASRYGLQVTEGAYINSITPGTGAANSDLKPGDIITAIDGKAVASASDVTLDVRAHNPGQTVTVTVNRDGETKEIPVTLSSDENLLGAIGSGNGQNQNQNPNQNPNSPYGYNYDNNGNGSGRSIEDILRMLGM